MTSSGLKLNFGDEFFVGAKNQRMGTDLGKRMRGTGQSEVKRPPNHDELTAAQHPNSKSRLGGSKFSRENSFQGFATRPSCDTDLRCEKSNPVPEFLLCFVRLRPTEFLFRKS